MITYGSGSWVNSGRIHFSKGGTIYGKTAKYGKVYWIKTDEIGVTILIYIIEKFL